MIHRRNLLAAALAAATLATALAAFAQAQAPQVLNIYSARHYQSDDAIYAEFTEQTGIKINRLDGKEEELLERIRNEGTHSPADILITVDASRLEAADRGGFFQPLRSTVLEARIPEHLRTPNWVAFSTRARVIVYNKATIDPTWVQTYEDLAAPRLKSQICVRSGAHPYNLSLGGAMIAHHGVAQTETWARGLVANFARTPKGGDTDQLRSVAAGECGVALSNSYYVARLMRSTKPEDQKVMSALAVVWPNQQGVGTHVNVSGAGILRHAPHREAAQRFLEYLASDTAQARFADGNNEWPAVASVKPKNEVLDKLGPFRADTMPIGKLAANAAEAQKVYDRVGWR